MRPGDRRLGKQICTALRNYAKKRALPGINSDANLISFVEQIVESIRRIKYVTLLLHQKDISSLRADPESELFDPLKAAILHYRAGRIDEAFWLIFIFVHFGKHLKTEWLRARSVYGGLGGGTWTWARTLNDPTAFRKWLSANQAALSRLGGFGNHRKYVSLSGASLVGTGAAFESYVKWVKPYKTHVNMVNAVKTVCAGDPRKSFDYLYKSMDAVVAFGRTAKFDYLTMIGKLKFAELVPASIYLDGATGPLKGINLLFTGKLSSKYGRNELESFALELESELCSFGVNMQVLEDSLCNWQKSPSKFKAFRG